MPIARRTKHKIGSTNVFAERRKDGTFKKITKVGPSLRADRRIKARTIVRSGQGHRGDQKRKGRYR